MKEAEELKNLLEAKVKIDARIKELQKADRYRKYGKTVELTKGEGGYSSRWKETYNLKIRKISARVGSEHGRYKTIAEDNNLNHIYIHLKHVVADLQKCIKDMEENMVGDKDA